MVEKQQQFKDLLNGIKNPTFWRNNHPNQVIQTSDTMILGWRKACRTIHEGQYLFMLLAYKYHLPGDLSALLIKYLVASSPIGSTFELLRLNQVAHI